MPANTESSSTRGTSGELGLRRPKRRIEHRELLACAAALEILCKHRRLVALGKAGVLLLLEVVLSIDGAQLLLDHRGRVDPALVSANLGARPRVRALVVANPEA